MPTTSGSSTSAPEKKERTVPRGYDEPVSPEKIVEEYGEPVADEESGELIGHAYVETPLPATAEETNAPADKATT